MQNIRARTRKKEKLNLEYYVLSSLRARYDSMYSRH